jgi:cytochrome c-type biogenesis protein CcmE
MKKSSKKIAIPLLLILAGVSLLIMKGISDTGVYYRTVAEVLADNSLLEKRGVRISGRVEEGTIEYNQKNLQLKFTVRDMENDNETMNVIYNGVKPDAFQEDIEVILEGHYEKTTNTFNAATLLAKCPSKYEGETEQDKEKKW